jgi:hypothetical protein
MTDALYRKRLVWVCAAAVALRVLAIVMLRAWLEPNAMEHVAIARNLVAGHGFSFGDFGYFGPTSYQSPTYPFFLAGLFQLLGTDAAAAYVVALLVNALLAGFAVVGVAAMTRELGGGLREALIAAAAFAVWPTQIYAATHAQSVVMITACVAWMIVFFTRGVIRWRARDWWLYSGIAATAALTEPALLPITALSVPLLWLYKPAPPRARLRSATIVIAAAALILGPWTLRNLSVHGTFVLVKSGFWVNVWKGANDYATGTDRLAMPEERRRELEARVYGLEDERGLAAEHKHQYDTLTPEQLGELQGKSEIERERIFRRYALTWIAANPGRFTELCLIRLQKSLWIDWDNPKSFKLPYIGSRALLLLLSVPGLVLALARGWRLFFPAMLVGSCLGIYTLTLTAARFAIPLEPVQLAIAALTLTSLLDRLRSREA